MATVHRIRRLAAAAFVVSLLGIAPTAAQQVPPRISYQGTLAEGDAPLDDDRVDLAFAFYARASGGQPLEGWTEAYDDEPVEDGRFSVLLGSRNGGVPASLFDGRSELWLEVRVNDEALPRVPLASTPYAFQAERVVDGAVGTSALADAAVTSDKIAEDAVTDTELDDEAAVTALNGLSGDVQIEGEDGASVDVSGNTLTIRGGNGGGGDGGDITAVTAGDGLSGGGNSGAVTLRIADGGVAAEQLAEDAVESEALADGVTVRSLNGQTDAVELTSSDGTVSIDASDGAIDLSASDGGDGDGGDITAVSAGGGLSGGGNSGAVTLRIAEEGVGTEELAGDAVTAPKLSTSNNPSAGEVLSYDGSDLAWSAAADGDGNGLTSVNTDGTLTGDGTPGSALGLANSAVTAAKLEPDVPGGGGSFVLTYEDGDLTWRRDRGDGDNNDGDLVGSSTQPSSIRWKEDVRTLEDPLALVERLRGVRYRWKESGEADVGVIAEEVAEVLPELVAFDDDGRARGVHYGKLAAVLVEATKQQQAALASKTRALERQQATIDRLHERVARLERLVERMAGASETEATAGGGSNP